MLSGFERLDRLSLPRHTRRRREGERNGNYRHGCRTKEMIENRYVQSFAQSPLALLIIKRPYPVIAVLGLLQSTNQSISF
jgi:hypothetical protein